MDKLLVCLPATVLFFIVMILYKRALKKELIFQNWSDSHLNFFVSIVLGGTILLCSVVLRIDNFTLLILFVSWLLSSFLFTLFTKITKK